MCSFNSKNNCYLYSDRNLILQALDTILKFKKSFKLTILLFPKILERVKLHFIRENAFKSTLIKLEIYSKKDL